MKAFYFLFPAKFVRAPPFAGRIPPELGKLGALRNLFLDDNKLSGEYATVRGSCTVYTRACDGRQLLRCEV